MTRLLLTTALTLFPAAAALAGPAYVPPAPPPVVVVVDDPFDGFYAGLEFGHVTGNGETDNGLVGANNVITDLEYDNGTAWGPFIGYNVQNGAMVFGGEGRYLHLDGFGFEGDYDIDYVADLRGRVGYVAGDALIYGAAGLSISDYTSGATSVGLTGYNIGAGVEYNVSERFFVRGDYTFRELTGTEMGLEVTQQINTLTIGAGLRF